MSTREEKIAAIHNHSNSLFMLASEYRKMAMIANVSSDEMIEILFRIKFSHDEINEKFAQELEEIMTPECERHGYLT